MTNFASLFAVTPDAIRARLRWWIVAAGTLLAYFGLLVMPSLQFETDLLALLPSERQDRALSAAVDEYARGNSSRVLFLIGADDTREAIAAADRFAQSLAQAPAFVNVTWRQGQELKQQVALLKSHAGGLLTERDARRIRDGQADALAKQAMREALSPMGLVQPIGFADDPLGLLNRFLLQQVPTLGNATLVGDHLIAKRDMSYVLVTAACAQSPFASDFQGGARAAIAAATSAAGAGVVVLESGVLQHAAAIAASAQQEVAWFGTLGSVILLVVVYLVLRGIRPIVLTGIVLLVSLTMAVTVTHWVFERVHLLALVFGSSLIGVVIDYSLHFLVDRLRDPNRWAPSDALKHIAPAIVWGCIATVCGYATLLWVPLPGLRQIALFCLVGSLTGCVSVLCLFGALGVGGATPAQWVYNIGRRLNAMARRLNAGNASRLVTAAVLVVLIGGGVPQLRPQDDLRTLQTSPPELMQREQRVQEVLGSAAAGSFFVVRAATTEELLQAQEALSERLQALIEQGALRGYMAMSRAIPSLAKQQQNQTLLRTAVLQDDGPLQRQLMQLGFARQAAVERVAVAAELPTLTFEEWIESSAAKAFAPLWLGKVGDEYAAVVTVSGVHDIAAVANAAQGLAGIHWVDRVASISQLLRDYRVVATWMWAAICGIVLAVLVLRFGMWMALRAALPCMVAALATLSVFGWLGLPVNLFVILGMLLVVALGIDYGMVLMHSDQARVVGVISVTLSAFTTSIGFGLLGLSSVQFIASIGLALCIGILTTWLLALAFSVGAESRA